MADYDMIHRLREQYIIDQADIQRLKDENDALRDVVKALTSSRDDWKNVASMFGEAFRIDEWGQYVPSDGSDVFKAVLAYEKVKYG